MPGKSGMHSGTLTIDGVFDGMLNGTGIVPAGAQAVVSGMINGTLVVERGAHVTITGMVNGPVLDRGGRIEATGIVGDIVAG